VVVVALAGVAGAHRLRQATAAGPEAPARPRLAFSPGARQAYALELASELHFAGARGEGPSTIRQHVAATLHLRVLDAGPEGARVGLQLADVRVIIQGRESAELDRQLGRPYLVTFAGDGTPLAFELPAGASAEARAVLEEIVRTFQVIVPAGDGPAWSTEEEHGAGRYVASYRLTLDGRIVKEKTGYLRGGPATAGAGARVTVRRSNATARLAPGVSWLDRMVVDEALSASLGQGVFTTSSLHGELAQVALEPPRASLLELDADVGRYAALLAGSADPAPDGLASRPAGPEARPLEIVLTDLDARRGRSAALIYELRRSLRLDPGAAGRLVARLRAGVADGTAAALLNALGMAGTPESQAALREVLGDPAFGRLDRLRAALALGGGAEVDDPSLAALRAVADGPGAEGLRDTALLSLGMAADRLRREEPDRYGAVRDDLLARARVGDGDRAATALLALGNARDPALAGAVAEHLDDPSPAARDAAARALGKLGGAGDPELLARRLAVEDDPAVRATLAGSLSALPAPSAAALALSHAALARERDPAARYDLARLLGEHLEAYPPGRAALAALSTQDPSRRIRQYAAHAVWGRR